MDILPLILSILLAILSITFIYWGIYQIKTGKMVAFRAKRPIDSPREVGVIFILLGIESLFHYTPLFYSMISTPLTPLWIFTSELAIFSSHILAYVNTAFFLILAIYSLKTGRIFGIKSDKSTSPAVRRFLPFAIIFSFILALLFPLEKALQFMSGTSSLELARFIANSIVFIELYVKHIAFVLLCLVYLLVFWQSRNPRKVAKRRKK